MKKRVFAILTAFTLISANVCGYAGEEAVYVPESGLETSETEPEAAVTEDEADGAGPEAAVTEDGADEAGQEKAVTEDEVTGKGTGTEASVSENGAAGAGPEAAVTEDGVTGEEPETAVSENGAAGEEPETAVSENEISGTGQEVAILADSADNAEASLQSDGNYNQSAARTHAKLVNKFRTSNTWMYNESNQKTKVSGLSELSYDTGLEDAAKIRAKELAQQFSHGRPDGTMFNTVFKGADVGRCGENIAMNSYGYDKDDAQEVLEQFKEENVRSYAEQGHRRNMLEKDFKYIGVARVTINGNNYWVQEFSQKPLSKNSKNKDDDDDNKKKKKKNQDRGWDLSSLGSDTQTVTDNTNGYSATITMSKSISDAKSKKDVAQKFRYSLDIKTPKGTQSGITVKKVTASKPKNGEAKVTLKLKNSNKEEKKVVKSLNKKLKKIPVKIGASSSSDTGQGQNQNQGSGLIPDFNDLWNWFK